MSFGNNTDDTNFERSAILQEAAVQIVVKERSEDEAINVAEQLYAKRMEAEKLGRVVLDDQGNATSYHDAALNPEPLTASQHEAVGNAYQKLCEKEGVEAF
ncbi:hypothetical protein SAMN04488490_1679 [Marinobacter sp. LV10R510-11A]|uniref:hypothetical protein n=1 Tax=Marinobacter sp. LV10R510-11A TaxID=1415568 RepID=UPI000BB697E0|nr:hypothetical protein [Marinobacter sp. LV10R510-11A]SOB76013.1 hypothetical protein SAMN04488490_1679 [Marinobacter sp. LV10R510-11A]